MTFAEAIRILKRHEKLGHVDANRCITMVMLGSDERETIFTLARRLEGLPTALAENERQQMANDISDQFHRKSK